jgi:taurine dioxygenase
MELRPLSPSLGAELVGTGTTLEPAPDLATAIRDALLRYHLVLIREVDLEARDQVLLLESLDLGHVLLESDGGIPWGWITNSRESVGAGGLVDTSSSNLLWHADYEFCDAGPIQLISLYSVECAVPGEPTLFASMTRAAAVLPPDLRSRVTGLRVVKAKDFGGDQHGSDRMSIRNRIRGSGPDSLFQSAEHDIISAHPVTGEQWLTPSHMMTSHVAGWSDEESDALFAELDAVAYAADNVYRHDWHPRDLVIWDNVALHHARGRTPAATVGVRSMRRVTVDGVDMKTRLGPASAS